MGRSIPVKMSIGLLRKIKSVERWERILMEMWWPQQSHSELVLSKNRASGRCGLKVFSYHGVKNYTIQSTHLWKLISLSPPLSFSLSLSPSLFPFLPTSLSNNCQKLSTFFHLLEIKGTKSESHRASQGIEEPGLPGWSSATLFEAALTFTVFFPHQNKT